MTTRKRSKQRISFTAAATFGAAMSSLYVAPELQADVVDITWNGGNATAVNAYNAGPSTFAVSQGIDQVVGVATVDFVQFNDFIGRTLIGGGSANIESFLIVADGQELGQASFAGSLAIPGTEFSGSGSAFVGFRSFNNNVGWFQVSFTDFGDIVYGAGQYGTDGENVTVGGAIPEPSAALALLAVSGAAGLRRRKA